MAIRFNAPVGSLVRKNPLGQMVRGLGKAGELYAGYKDDEKKKSYIDSYQQLLQDPYDYEELEIKESEINPETDEVIKRDLTTDNVTVRRRGPKLGQQDILQKYTREQGPEATKFMFGEQGFSKISGLGRDIGASAAGSRLLKQEEAIQKYNELVEQTRANNPEASESDISQMVVDELQNRPDITNWLGSAGADIVKRTFVSDPEREEVKRKVAKETRETLKTIGSSEFTESSKKLMQARKAMESLKSVIEDDIMNNPVAQNALVTFQTQLIEPGLAVREDDRAVVANSLSSLNQIIKRAIGLVKDEKLDARTVSDIAKFANKVAEGLETSSRGNIQMLQERGNILDVNPQIIETWFSNFKTPIPRIDMNILPKSRVNPDAGKLTGEQMIDPKLKQEIERVDLKAPSERKEDILGDLGL